MKITPREADRLVENPDKQYRAYLIFGPDRGLAHERANTLVQSLLEDPNDPFALSQFSDEDLKSDPAALADAMAAMSLTGGKRVVRVRLSGETGSAPILDMVEMIEGDAGGIEATLIVESGDLTPRGKLRKTFEPARKAAAIACYADNAQSLEDLTRKLLAEEGLVIEASTWSHWLPRLEGDRALARGEIEKLILYKGLKGQRSPGDDEITLSDIESVAADHGESGLDQIIGPLFDGNVPDLDRSYARALSAGTSPVAILRAVQRRIDQFGLVHAAGGQDQALARSGAPRFGPQAAQFKRQLGFWRGRKLDAARQLAFDAERQIKRSGSPSDAIIGELMLRLARGASRARH
ncbi:MAG: DNA polymerase III subunit delta [Alphaproteobacteria bacterium]|nr:DNA polymerase III subunit delta [Alphaproteobacteria bacterium]